MHENRETSPLPAEVRSRPVREGKRRKTDMNGGEESDGGIVPVKDSNEGAI